MYSNADRHLLKKLARDSISYGLSHGKSMPLENTYWPESVEKEGAAFVTLYIHGALRGCIGSLQSHRRLVVDIAENAFAAAFRDHRFPPLEESELADLEIHISILTPPTPIPCDDEASLLHELQPNIDGLIIEDDSHKATFLPSVWESLPQAKLFVEHLKVKAGLPAHYWSPKLRCYRYQTESF